MVEKYITHPSRLGGYALNLDKLMIPYYKESCVDAYRYVACSAFLIGWCRHKEMFSDDDVDALIDIEPTVLRGRIRRMVRKFLSDIAADENEGNPYYYAAMNRLLHPKRESYTEDRGTSVQEAAKVVLGFMASKDIDEVLMCSIEIDGGHGADKKVGSSSVYKRLCYVMALVIVCGVCWYLWPRDNRVPLSEVKELYYRYNKSTKTYHATMDCDVLQKSSGDIMADEGGRVINGSIGVYLPGGGGYRDYLYPCPACINDDRKETPKESSVHYEVSCDTIP